MLKIDYVISGELEVNCYLVYDDITKKVLIIDPGQDDKAVINKITKLNLQPELLINTHGHFDHILSDDIIREKYNVPLAVHKTDLPMLLDSDKNASVIIGIPTQIKPADILFDNEKEFSLSFCKYSTINTPGHTAGSICILINNFLFSGDTLFAQSIGRIDLPTGSASDMEHSLNKLKKLNTDIIVYPGHGPSTTIKRELLSNPYLK